MKNIKITHNPGEPYDFPKMKGEDLYRLLQVFNLLPPEETIREIVQKHLNKG